MRQSMTGFASGEGELDGLRWSWEVRSVNGKGLELRLRLPEGIEGLEAALRKAAADKLRRGNVQIALRLQGDEAQEVPQLDEAYLEAVLLAMGRVTARAGALGIALAPANPADIVGLRGVMTHQSTERDTAALRDALVADFPRVLDALVDVRRREGAALQNVLEGQIAEIEALVQKAGALAEARRADQKARIETAFARVTEMTDADPQRIAQELALIAVKADVTEELDRLRAHIAAARDLLADTGPVGRKLDFLAQEFNREANTLCSKSGFADLTQAGLALKTVIDQMREQVQNVE